MMPGKRAKGNLDPSRSPAAPGDGSVRDKHAAGRGGRAVPRNSAGAGDWRAAADRAALDAGRLGCNSAARGHNGGREKIQHGIRCRSKPAAGEPLRRAPPCAFADGARQRRPLRGNLKPASVGAPSEGRHPGTPPLLTVGSHSRFPPSSQITPSAQWQMIGPMICALGADEVACLGSRSENYVFR